MYVLINICRFLFRSFILFKFQTDNLFLYSDTMISVVLTFEIISFNLLMKVNCNLFRKSKFFENVFVTLDTTL